MEIPTQILDLIQEGKSLEILLETLKQMDIEEKEKSQLEWDIEEAKILFDLKKEQKRLATSLIYSSYFSMALSSIFLLINKEAGESLFWPIMGILSAIVLYMQGKNVRNRRVTLGKERLINKGYFKRF